ncbi:MAG: OmpA family protein [Desulfobacteraceae bacterium]
MMRNMWRPFTMIALASLLASACATPGAPPAMDIQAIPNGQYQEKVDVLYFILDASSSMAEGYNGLSKFEVARSVIGNFNKTMPDVKTQVALRSFGHDDKVSRESTALMAPLEKYRKASLSDGLNKVSKAGGISPLARALKTAGEDLEGNTRPMAMVIVSDGKDMGQGPLAAAEALKAALGDRLCIYTVLVGDDHSGGRLLSQIADVSGCGKAVTADSLATGAAMNAFVREVLLTGLNDRDGDGVPDRKDKCPNTPAGVKVDMSGCPLDSDRDGVPDYKDQCPGTPAGVKVDSNGCPLPVPTKSAEVTAAGTWIYKDIKFEVNKADLRQSSFPVLNEIVGALEAQPDLKIEIQGHTDSTGAHDYNVGLSQRRAESVKAYLVSKGIASHRLTTRGYGPDRPIASNTTKEGRARNRRVEVKPIQ